MKKAFVFITLLCMFSMIVIGQNTITEEKQLVQNTVNDLFQGLAELDSQKVRQSCIPEIKIFESGKVWTIDSLILRVTTRKKKSMDFKRINEFDFIETKIDGNVAWTSYFNKAIISFDGKTVTIKWLESVILQKIKNTWKIALLHSTEMERTD